MFGFLHGWRSFSKVVVQYLQLDMLDMLTKTLTLGKIRHICDNRLSFGTEKIGDVRRHIQNYSKRPILVVSSTATLMNN